MSAEHGIESATYMSDGNRYLPLMCCLCGFYAHALTWEEAGRELDEHLVETVSATAEGEEG